MLVTVFSSIENGIYTTICVSIALLLFRVVKARGRFLGKVQVHSVIGDHLLEDKDKPSNEYGHEKADRSIFLPLEHNDGSNPMIDAKSPYPGIFIYRFSEGYNYPNANHYLDYMVQSIFQQTRRTNPNAYGRPGDRPWNDPGPRRGKTVDVDYDKPTLKAVILDFSSVNNVDVTSVQHLIDVRNQLDRYSSPEKVQWHFAHINNRWTRRALASAGFGYPTEDAEEFKRWKPIFSVAELGGTSSAAADAEYAMNHAEHKKHRDLEIGRSQSREITGESSETSSDINQTIHNSKAYGAQTSQKKIVVHGLNRPFFHIDLTSALQSAIANIHDPSATADVVQDDDKLA